MKSFLVLFFISHLISQSASIRFKNISINDGLSDFFIYSLLEDRHGILWMGSQEGLNKYDGRDVLIFRREAKNRNSLSDNFVFCLEEDSDGRIWIGTSKGLNSYDPVKKEFRHFFYNKENTNTIKNDGVQSLLYDSLRNGLWIGTNSGLDFLNLENDSIKRIWPDFLPNDMESAVISMLLTDSVLYFGTRVTGFFSLKGNLQHSINHLGLKGHQIRSIIKDNRSFWVASYKNSIYKYNPGNGKFTKKVFFKEKEKNELISHIKTIFIDGKKLYIGTDGEGLVIYNLASAEYQVHVSDDKNKYSLPNNFVSGIKKMKTGLLAISTRGGVSFLDKYEKPFQRIDKYSYSQKFPSYNIRAILKENRQNTWIGSQQGGLYLIDDKKNKNYHYTHNPKNPFSISDNHVRTLFLDSDNQLWIGTANGLNKFDRKRNRFLRFYHEEGKKESLSNNFISSIIEDKTRNLWIATYYGYSVMNIRDHSIKSHVFADGDIDNNDIRSLFIDREDNLWFGTWNGLFKLSYDKKDTTFYRHEQGNPNSISSNIIFAINEDKIGRIWIGSAGGGLDILDPKTNRFKHYDTKDGLSNNTIHGILFDKQNNAWLSTYKGGLIKVGNSSLHNGMGKFKIYTQADGLHDNSFHPNSFYKTADSYFYFGGINGISSFYPDSIRDLEVINSVYLKSFKLFNHDVPIKNRFSGNEKKFVLNKSIHYTKKINLSYYENFFSIDFSAIEFRSPEKINYAYMLEGFDTDWVYSANRSFANYTKISPGAYRFMVRSTNKNGKWLNNTREILIEVSSPFWEKWWFYLILVSLVILVFYLIHNFRLKQILAIDKIKSKISYGLHDELASNLSSIIMFSSLIDHKDKASESNTALKEKISKLAVESVGSVKDLIWIIDDKEETLIELVNRFEKQLKENCHLNEINCSFKKELSAEIKNHVLVLEDRDNLWFFLKEAVTNIFKHGDAKVIEAYFIFKAGELLITIRDNGIGFDINLRKEGRGLKIMKKRALALNARFQLKTSPGRGTDLSLRLKLS